MKARPLVADPLEAARAIDGVTVARHEGNGRRLAALGADDLGLGPLLETEARLADGSAF